ncbi:unnamed protein product [Thlaspi arvense]|uniref:non-specific serine/threonine protein kinase n=1 Tax=Thlaspi arvense TaxID=13288 RepID=A0AAU9RL52_THLAR|nr:unnamed protein product [Thlaspi arvense]
MADEEKHVNPEAALPDSTTKDAEGDDLSSPRAVLEVPVSGSSDSDTSSTSSSGGGSCGGSIAEKSSGNGAHSPQGHGGLQWRKLIDNVKRRSVRGAEDEMDCGDLVVPKPSWRNFSHAELAAATDNFSSEKLIGKGGHAEVYKGCLPDGEVVAVKKITKKNKNGEDRVGDFLSELGIIAHINHSNAAKLVGFSSDDGLHLVLHLGNLTERERFSISGSSEYLEWKIRFKVALGVAEGLRYLHYECPRRIIHRDITASNILLTEDYEPQISDFGLAKWLPENWAHHVVHPIEGTFGYMAPEYFMHGVVDEKTDVFAFGVLLLELITGRRAVDSCRQSLVMWAKPLLEKGHVKDIADPRLGDTYDSSEMQRAIVKEAYSALYRCKLSEISELECSPLGDTSLVE